MTRLFNPTIYERDFPLGITESLDFVTGGTGIQDNPETNGPRW